MGYEVTHSNSLQFVIDGEKYALACVMQEEETYGLSIFRQDPDGWKCVPPFLRDGLSNEEIMSYGSVAGYLQYMLPLASKKLQGMFANQRPDHANKPECVGYDLSKDVAIDLTTLTFSLNKQPPLSHAR